MTHSEKPSTSDILGSCRATDAGLSEPRPDNYKTIEIQTLADFPEAISQLVTDLCDRVIPLQVEFERPWSEIRFELWIDSGRVIAFPAESRFTERTDVAGCQICCIELRQKVEELDARELTDADYETRFIELESQVAILVRDAFDNQSVAYSILNTADLES